MLPRSILTRPLSVTIVLALTALGEAVTVVSGPELKSKWVGESEENLRAVFMKARHNSSPPPW